MPRLQRCSQMATQALKPAGSLGHKPMQACNEPPGHDPGDGGEGGGDGGDGGDGGAGGGDGGEGAGGHVGGALPCITLPETLMFFTLKVDPSRPPPPSQFPPGTQPTHWEL